MALGAGLAAPALAQARPRVVVLGGGAGGATAARYVAKDAAEIAVTLISEQRIYTTCFFSNLYLAGFRSLQSITHDYSLLESRHGVRFIGDRAIAIDRDARELRLAAGDPVSYDRLILAPGISMRSNAIEGYDAAAASVMPHSYVGGFQSYLLRRKLQELPPGGVFALAAPPNPYRCPPGPYERVSMIARLLSRINPRAKILVFDAKDSFAKQRLFEEGWADSYPGMIEWTPASLSGGGVVRVDPAAMTVTLGAGDVVKVDGACVIPPMQAGAIAIQSGLTDSEGWAPIEADSMRSTVDSDVFVVGDASRAGDMPKSGFAANSQAHVAALSARADLLGATRYPSRYSNTCWSFVDRLNVVKVGASYQPVEGAIKAMSGFVSDPGEDEKIRLDNALEANSWYAAITADMFS